MDWKIIIGGGALVMAALAFWKRRPIMEAVKGLSDAGASFIARWEAFRWSAYQDIAGVWTIGFGHTGPDVFPGLTITLEEARELMKADAQEKIDAINRMVRAPLTQNQGDALTSLVYNIGEGNFAGSTTLRELNRGNFQAAADAIELWNKATIDGELTFVQGLANRRAAEKRLFLS